jgi:hypothetical protein
LPGYPTAGGGEQDGGEHEGDELELVIVGGAAGAAGEQVGQEVDGPAQSRAGCVSAP